MPSDETLRDKTIRLRPGRGGRSLVRLDQPFDPDARGVLAGLTTQHGRAELYRATLEGTAFGVRQDPEGWRRP